MALLHEGRLVADGRPRDVLVGEAASHSFGVTIRAHEVPETAEVVFRFLDRA